MNRQSSYTAASAFPVKALKRSRYFYRLGKLYPDHVQLCPTNVCNLSCKYCSCANRYDLDFLLLTKALDIMQAFSDLGAVGVTVTGGGEPLMHPHFDEMMEGIQRQGYKIGLVSNGVALGKQAVETLRRMTWTRVSCSDDRDVSSLLHSVANAFDKAPHVDWAFSYVVTRDFDSEKLAEVLRFANEHSFTHVRVVSDLIDLENVPDVGKVMTVMQEMGVHDKLAIYQGRKRYTRGTEKCLISLIKPVVGADGNIYPCCGVQYAFNDLTLDFPASMSMGSDPWQIYNAQAHFDGSQCMRCYYMEYNKLLCALTEPVEHEEFV